MKPDPATSTVLKRCSVLRSCVTDGTGQGCAAASKNLRQSVSSEFTVNADARFCNYKKEIINIVRYVCIYCVSLGFFPG